MYLWWATAARMHTVEEEIWLQRGPFWVNFQTIGHKLCWLLFKPGAKKYTKVMYDLGFTRRISHPKTVAFLYWHICQLSMALTKSKSLFFCHGAEKEQWPWMSRVSLMKKLRLQHFDSPWFTNIIVFLHSEHHVDGFILANFGSSLMFNKPSQKKMVSPAFGFHQRQAGMTPRRPFSCRHLRPGTERVFNRWLVDFLWIGMCKCVPGLTCLVMFFVKFLVDWWNIDVLKVTFLVDGFCRRFRWRNEVFFDRRRFQISCAKYKVRRLAKQLSYRTLGQIPQGNDPGIQDSNKTGLRIPQ